ncbi:hypothetical protein DPEC_G00335490 [Dallia pectoralis]|uniref:Uncharacterized protein n=1 Tax=Dallia pectoralis TaxID=75939 RepID=A0ACC2F6Z4_DALPE|nr:hypothetical protein DPEC_G00335490 [Dallia pectoralis]
MLASQTRNKPQCREITGHTPHAVAIRAKFPSSRPPDYLTLERRKQEDAQEKVLEFTKYQNICDLKTNWEKDTDRRIVLGTIARRVKDAMGQYQMSIDERRDRLHDMLEEEEMALLKEMETKKETVLEKQAKMRERAKLLRDRREGERKRVVEDKLEQLFREQSEELRAEQTRRRQEEVCTERAAQLRARQEEQRQAEDEQQLFARLWESDWQAKTERESLEAQRQRQSNLEQVAYLRVQMEAAVQHREQARRLQEEEAQLLREQREMMRLEEQREHRQKLQGQESRRRLLDHSLRLKMRRLAREQQEELVLDMSILEQLLTGAEDEKEGEARKFELREEERRYRQHLANQLEEQKRQEAETEELIETELRETLTRREAQHRKEKEARNRLMKDVMDTRRLQIQEKLDLNMQKQTRLVEERDELNRTIQDNKLLDEEEKKRLTQARQEFQADLLAQMMYKRRLHEEERAQTVQEHQQGLAYQEQYNRKMEEILSRPASHTRAVHPFRRTSSTSRQLSSE